MASSTPPRARVAGKDEGRSTAVSGCALVSGDQASAPSASAAASPWLDRVIKS